VPSGQYGDVSIDLGSDFVATVELHRPPANYFNVALIRSIAEAYEDLDADDRCRAIVLCSEGKHFCAGADFTGASDAGPTEPGEVYVEAARLFETSKPVVAAVQGAAIGGGLGLACSADFRVGGRSARFSANFARLGFHHGFGLTVTLPPIVGQQRALELLYTGARIDGRQAWDIGLVDRFVPDDADVRTEARALAAEIAQSAPLAVASIKRTMRGDLAERFRAATRHEQEEQDRLIKTKDFAEGVRATAERRTPNFEGR
jgi:enoyl-CoA hydratase/carnithine racemase